MATERNASGAMRLHFIIFLCIFFAAFQMISGSAEAKSVNGSSCPNSTVSFDNVHHEIGDVVTLSGSSASGTWRLCIYDMSSASANNIVVTGAPKNSSISYTPQKSTTLIGSITTGGSCPMSSTTAGQDCRADSVVVAAKDSDDEDSTDSSADSSTDASASSSSACDANSWFFCNPLAGTVDSLEDAGTKFIQAILGLIGTVALFFLVYAGAMYITAAGQEEKVKSAKKIISGTVIGLAIALLAFSLLQTVLSILQ